MKPPVRPFDKHTRSGWIPCPPPPADCGGLFAGEHRASAAEAGGDFVGDQEYAVHVANARAEVQVVVRMPPAHCSQRFQDQRAHLAGVFVEQPRQRVGRVSAAPAADWPESAA